MEQIDRLREGLAGQYDVEKAVGQGGMATVYLARDVRHDRRVAIKVLKPELAASLGHERFLREIKLAAQLQHPNILGFYESGETNNLVYYVMPFVEGESLRDRIDKEKQLPIEDAVRIVREAGEALGYAHSHGIIHRDIKPENILLMNGHALVADFGIAKAVEAAGGEKLTETGMAVGTPHYMSPEQALGGQIDGRSDQYALACVLYETLIGQSPFDGPNPMAILARHAMEQVPSMQVVRSAIPDAVEDVVLRALEKTPADRFPSMKEFCEALEDAEAEVMMQRTMTRRAAGARTAQHRAAAAATRRATTPIQVETTAPKKKLPLMIAAGLAALALAGGGFWFVKGRGASPAVAATDATGDAKRIAVLYFEDQSTNRNLAYLADGLTEDLIRQLASVQGLDVISQNGVAPFRDPAIARDSVARALKVGTIVAGSIEQAGPDKVRVTARLVDASGTEFKRSSFEQSASDPLAMRDLLAGRVAEFLRERLGEEVRVREQRSATKSTDAWVLMQRAEAARKDAEAASAKGDTTASGRAFVAADSIAKLASDKDPQWNEPGIFRASLAFRRARIASGNPKEELRFIEQGLSQAETVLGRDAADAQGLEWRGSLRYIKWLGNLEPDPAAAKQLLAAAKKDLQEATRIDPTRATAWAMLSHLYYQDGEITDVLLAARRAYETDAYLATANTVLSRLFFASYDLNQEVDAAHWCEEGRRRFPNDPRFATCELYLMTMRGQNADVDKAWKLASSDAIKNDPTRGQPEFQVKQAQMLVAAVIARAGLKDSAKAVATRAEAGTDIDPTRDLLHIKAFVLKLAGDTTGAIRELKSYIAANPEIRETFGNDPGWWFRDLSANPAFSAAFGQR